MNGILCRQLALDYCCSPEEVADGQNHFSPCRPLEGRRRFLETEETGLKIAAVNGKLLFTGREEILARCRERYESVGSAWFFEFEALRELDALLRGDGWRIGTAHPFFLSETPSEIDASAYGIRWYRGAEIEAFRGDGRFREAFSFCPEAPDVLGVAALRGGRILGMAGASADSPTMWQIGINVEPEARGEGVASMLVGLLKNEILKSGILPFYGTAVSHIASQRTALAAGFLPAWAELVTTKIG